MLRLTLPYITAVTAAIATPAAAIGEEFREGVVKSHPSQGEIIVVENAVSRVHSAKNGVYVNFRTRALKPGHVHTLWLVSINKPVVCEAQPCSSNDVLQRSSIVESDVTYAGGTIADSAGVGSFSFYQPKGPNPGGWFGAGIQNTKGAEFHLVVNDHGPVVKGLLGEMLTTYRGGCTDESIPAPMPISARKHGTPGPNACRLVQFSIFTPKPQS